MYVNNKENTTYCDYMISKNGGLPLRHHTRRNRHILVMSPEPSAAIAPYAALECPKSKKNNNATEHFASSLLEIVVEKCS
jgi:hypothetical protein